MKLVLAAFALFLLGCTAPFPDNPTHPATLLDARFVVDHVTVGGGDKLLLPTPTYPDGRMRVDFDYQLVGVAGCNWWTFEPWSIDGGRLFTVGDNPPDQTLIGCSGPYDDQDRWLVGFLRSGPTVTTDGNLATVSNGDTVVSLILESCTRPTSLAPIEDCASVH